MPLGSPKPVRPPLKSSAPVTLYTVGHSNRTLEFFVSLLLGYGIQRLVDVRTIPRSRHNPQFNGDTLPLNLQAAGVSYSHIPGLGGLRHAQKDSLNTGWKNSSFRGYADYMQTGEFEENLERLMRMAQKERIAIMCAEAVPWRCHRSLIADALVIRKVQVRHIMSRVSAPLHELTPWATVREGRVFYPPSEREL